MARDDLSSHPEEDINWREIPPIGALFAIILFAGYTLLENPISGDMAYLNWVIAGFGIIGVLYFLYQTYRKYQENGITRAVGWMITAPAERDGTTSSTENQTEKVPPPSNSLKNELYFERADQQCEWCGEDIDAPEVHHITPRSEGGSNDRSNLIVLCPNCHRKADKGVMSKSKLQYKVRESKGS
ncbi:MAG: HNH endonuclease [Candidatus Nanohaloarchaea archaeon]